MLELIHNIWVITIEYEGLWRYMLVLYAVSLLYLLITERNKKTRMVAVYIPLTTILLIACPLFLYSYYRFLDDSGTYYRVFWLLPIAVTIAYASCKAIYRYRRVGLIIIIAAIILCGTYSYKETTSTGIRKVENAYHIPQYVIELADNMKQDIEGVNVYACVPAEITFYIRQYDPNICLVFGRDAIEPKWGYYDEFYEIFELEDVVDMKKLLELTRNNNDKICTYFVIPDDRELSEKPEKCGLVELTKVDKYILYRDTVATDKIKEMFKGTAYEQ